MEGSFPEQFKCPICFEIPEKEIFQCQNGHTICDICIQSLSLCPQCRIELGTSKIRNRGLEELLDMMKFDCSYKSDGCKTKVSRKELTSHDENCTFGGDLTPLCENLGFSCAYKFNIKKLDESLKHLHREHSFLSSKGVTADMKLTNISKTSNDSTILWTPVIFSTQNSQILIVVYSIEERISILSFSIGQELNTKLQIKFGISSSLDHCPILEWITKPIPYSKSTLTLKCIPFQLCLDFKTGGYIERDDLTIRIQISDNNFNNSGINKLTETQSIWLLPKEIKRSMMPISTQNVESEDICMRLHDKFRETLLIIGEGPYCNACVTRPINGVVYRCLQCQDYDLCSDCMMKKEHSFHHFSLLCSDDQVISFFSKVIRNEELHPYVDCTGNKNIGYKFGSMLSDTREWRCQQCRKPPDYICLQCPGPYGLCKCCFLTKYEQHDKHHFFIVTMNDSSRQFALFVLREHKVLPQLAHEIDS